ncbi:DUF2303 family protein [Roseobacter sp. TSBP12]|uniref:DUF2303 family protein n=1 Tax=Roseobacter sp. TSBP12 TaxID=1236613 RepID=UPI00125FD920|nr:DUF2303 family protein [Roseobacter sp. TSBP12]KAB6714300.1 hypothetical protein C8029_21410 [Roseobacter sp. TSBP12]
MSDTLIPENPAETMRKVMEDLGHHMPIEFPKEVDFTKPVAVAVPKGRDINYLTQAIRDSAEFLKPARRKGTAKLSDLDSLITWANRFKSDESVLFANPDMTAPKLTCIADYHAMGPVDVTSTSGDPTARHCHHRAIYDFPLSDEWVAWMKISDTLLEKDDLGEFIEAQAKDIMDPTPAILSGRESDEFQDWENRLIQTAQKIEGRFGQLGQLLAMSKQFQVYEASNLTVSTNRDTGEAQVQFLNEHKDADGQPLRIPNLIIITIPVFMGGAPYRMAVRFRYRKMGGSVKFILSIYNPEKAFKASFSEAVDIATEQTGLTTLMGAPEA